MDLKYIDIKIKNEDLALIVFYSSSSSFEILIDTLLYEKCSISLNDVSYALK